MRIVPFAASLLLSLPLVSAWSPPVHADSPGTGATLDAPAGRRGTAGGALVLETGGGRVFHTGRAITNLFVADPKVAEARPASPNSVFVFGVGVGRTTVAALDEAGNVLAQYDVLVRPSSFSATEGSAAIRRDLPGSDIRVQATPEGVTTEGLVASPLQAERASAAARTFLTDKGQKIDNRTILNTGVQVTLKVRIAEISRNITRQLGINWTVASNFGRFGIAAALTDGLSLTQNAPQAIAGSFNDGRTSVNTLLDVLAEDQLITMLAEPNLTARSGETASFLAGGEFPIPISANNGSISVQFKQYGVSLSFVPTILTDGRISLHVRPEVSALTTTGSVSLPVATGLFGTSTITIPALTVRRTDTTVELGSGQSFAIAGLLQDQNTFAARGLPYLGEIPVLGALFKSDLFQRGKSELVIVITPYIVSPVSAPGAVKTPADDFVPAGDLGRVLLLRQRAVGTGPGSAARLAPIRANAPVPLAPPVDGRVSSSSGFILP